MKRNEATTKLKARRLAAGLTQQEVAYLAEISKRSYEKLEQGERTIDTCHLDTILKVCIALKCSIEDILEEPGLYLDYLSMRR